MTQLDERPLIPEDIDPGDLVVAATLVKRPTADLATPTAATPPPRGRPLLVAVRRGGAHLVTTLAKPDATHVQAARFATRHGWVVSRGAMSWANRAYGGATHGHLREQVRIARLAGDREGLKEWIELLNDARNDRIHRLVNLPKALLGVLLAIGVAAGLALVLALLVGVVSFFTTGPAGWVEWWALVGATLAFLAGLVALLWHIATWLLWPVLGWAAWREGKRVADPPMWLLTTDERAMVGGEIDERTITLALSHLGIKALNDYLKNGGLLTYTVPARRDGDGTYAQVRVPLGVTAEEIAARRNKLAGNLSRAALETWPTKGDEENVLELWVADKGLLGRGAGEWPLLHDGDCDVFAGVPVGRSQRGDLIQTPLFETNWLVGGRPGQGKTSALRTLLLGAALDPTVELWVFVMGESPDFDPFRPRLSRYAMGLDDEVFEAALLALRDGLSEMERRGKVLGTLPGKPPKTSRKLAKRVELGLHPLVITMDEVHELFGHPKYGKEAAELAIRLIKRGRKYGIILKLATQSPVADSIPREVTRNVSNGVAFSVADHVPNDALLGAGRFKAGIRATELRPTVDRGTSVAVGLTDAPFELIRWFYIVYEDGIDAVTPIITRAVQSMGPLRHTGPGETPTAPPDHLQAVEEAMRGEERVGTTEVLKRLAQDDPLTYQQPAWNHTRLTGLLAESGHEPRKLTGGRMFVVLDDVLDALARREAAEDDDEA